VRQSEKIAIIYFSRSAEQEARHKSWSAQSTIKQRLSISKFLGNQTLRTLKNSSFDLITFDEHKQVGDTFGEKLGNAFQETFALGYDAAITVGNDCIQLSKVDFEDVKLAVLNRKAVLGPTYRNGAYLIGLHKSQFNQSKFEELRWQSSELEDDLCHYFLSEGANVVVLEKLRDINNLRDFREIMSDVNLGLEVRRRIRAFVAQKIDLELSLCHIWQTTLSKGDLVLRGPPVAC